LALVFAAGVLAAAVAGCGGGGQAAPVSPEGAAQQLLAQRDLARYPPGTPARALFEWWRSAQFADALGYRTALAPLLRAKFDAQPRRLDALNYFAGAIRNARPKITNVNAAGGLATVYTLVEFRQPVGTSRFITSSVPRAFEFARVGRKWALADDSFVQATLPATLRRSAIGS
jgi:hypothetical protein